MEILQKSAALQGTRPWRTGERVAKIQMLLFLALRSELVLYLPIRGFVSCDSAATWMRIRIVRCQRPVKRQKHKPCETKARFFFSLLPVGSQESVLKVPKRGQFHAAIRVTISRCDSCAQGAPRGGR